MKNKSNSTYQQVYLKLIRASAHPRTFHKYLLVSRNHVPGTLPSPVQQTPWSPPTTKDGYVTSASPNFSHLSWDSPNQVQISQCKYFRKLLRTIHPEYKKSGKWVFNSKHNTFFFEKLQHLHFNVCIIFYSVGRRAAGSHWQESKKK